MQKFAAFGSADVHTGTVKTYRKAGSGLRL